MSNGKLNVVTGGTGYVGYALVKLLAEKKERMRLFLLEDSEILDGIECEKVIGNLLNPEDLVKTFEGADTVYHIAGVVDISGRKDKLLWAVNVEGTKNVIAACKQCGVKNLIYVSSVDAIPVTDDMDEISEISHFIPDVLEGTYAKTKATATQCVLDSGDDDLKVCVVHPTACVGPDDYMGSSICTMIKMYLKGMFPVSLGFGAYNFVDVRDVAMGMYLAAQKGTNKTCYILSGERMVLHEFISTLAYACGNKPPKIKMSKKAILTLLPVIAKAFDIMKLPPVLNEYSIRKLEENCNFTHARATNELGYNPRGAVEALTDTVNWMKTQINK